MPFEQWGYQFDGPHTDPTKLEARSGVYVIWSKNGDTWKVLDVGESANVSDRVSTHDRADCWKRHNKGTIYYSATYTQNLQQAGRREIEKKIRDATNPPCGDR